MYYIFKNNGECIASCNNKPNVDDLESRGETAVESNENYNIAKIKLDNGNIVVVEPTLAELKAEKHNEAGALFAQKRDAIRQVQISDGNTYGFDCANEDITNFLASWEAAKISGSTPYKVWLNSNAKTLIVMQLDDFTTVFNAVRTSQLEAYAWYNSVDAQIQAAETKEELDAIELE